MLKFALALLLFSPTVPVVDTGTAAHVVAISDYVEQNYDDSQYALFYTSHHCEVVHAYSAQKRLDMGVFDDSTIQECLDN